GSLCSLPQLRPGSSALRGADQNDHQQDDYDDEAAAPEQLLAPFGSARHPRVELEGANQVVVAPTHLDSRLAAQGVEAVEVPGDAGDLEGFAAVRANEHEVLDRAVPVGDAEAFGALDVMQRQASRAAEKADLGHTLSVREDPRV